MFNAVFQDWWIEILKFVAARQPNHCNIDLSIRFLSALPSLLECNCFLLGNYMIQQPEGA